MKSIGDSKRSDKKKKPIKPCKGAIWNAVEWRWDRPIRTIKKCFKVRKPIRVRSKKKAFLDRIYAEKRKWFLAAPENSECPVARAGLIPDDSGAMEPHYRPAVQLHHRKGRGKYYLDQTTFLGVSAEGHFFIHHVDSGEARKRGWMLSRE